MLKCQNQWLKKGLVKWDVGTAGVVKLVVVLHVTKRDETTGSFYRGCWFAVHYPWRSLETRDSADFV